MLLYKTGKPAFFHTPTGDGKTPVFVFLVFTEFSRFYQQKNTISPRNEHNIILMLNVYYSAM